MGIYLCVNKKKKYWIIYYNMTPRVNINFDKTGFSPHKIYYD